MIDRYKKKGGFQQLLTLLETSGKQKQEQFLTLIAAENPKWAEALKCRILTMDRILGWDESYRVEVLTRVQPLTLAVALHDFEPERLEELIKPFPQSVRRKIKDTIDETKPTRGERATCVAKVITEVRHLIDQGTLKLDKIDPDLAIPEYIEDQLNGFQETDVKIEVKPENVVPGSTEEFDFLKRRVGQLQSEINHLKTENDVLKEKLTQIRKIA